NMTNTRTRNPAARIARATVSAGETPSVRYIAADRPRYGTNEVATARVPRQRHGTARGASESRHGERFDPGFMTAPMGGRKKGVRARRNALDERNAEASGPQVVRRPRMLKLRPH